MKQKLPRADELPQDGYSLGGIKVNVSLEGSTPKTSSKEILRLLTKGIREGVFSSSEDNERHSSKTSTALRHN